MADLKISALTASTTPLGGTEVLPIVQSGTTKKVSVANLTAGRAVSMTKLTANIPSGTTYHEFVADGLLNYSTVGYLISSFNAATVAGTPGVYVGYNSSTKAGIVGPAAVGGAPNQGLEVWAYDNATGFKQVGTFSSVTAKAGLTLNMGNLIVQSGNGIDFSATAGTGTSELLADYEEGTWTPVVIGTTSAGTGTYTVQQAHYVKVGNVVNFTLALGWSAHTGTGNIEITGLPFSIPGSQDTAPCSVFCWGLTFVGQLTAVTTGTKVQLYQIATASAATAVAMDTAVAALNISGFYFTS